MLPRVSFEAPLGTADKILVESVVMTRFAVAAVQFVRRLT